MEKGVKIALWITGIGAGLTTIFLIIKAISASSKPPVKPNGDTSVIDKTLIDNVGSNEITTQTKIQSDILPFNVDRGNSQGGSEGLGVGELQVILNYLYGSNLVIDGKFGNSVRQALNSNLPLTVYTCNSVTALLGKSSCDVDKIVWDYLIAQIAKKGPAIKFTDYLNSNSDFQKLKLKYK